MSVSPPGMTTQDPFCSQDQTFERAMNFESFNGIFRAGGVIPAGFWQGRGDDPLVNLYGYRQHGNQEPAEPAYQEKPVHLNHKILKPGHIQ